MYIIRTVVLAQAIIFTSLYNFSYSLLGDAFLHFLSEAVGRKLATSHKNENFGYQALSIKYNCLHCFDQFQFVADSMFGETDGTSLILILVGRYQLVEKFFCKFHQDSPVPVL